MKNGEKVLECIGLWAAILAGLLVSISMNGYVLTVFWRWFLLPIFQLPDLSFPQGTGIALLIVFLTRQTMPSADDKEWLEIIGGFVGTAIFWPLLAVLLGYIVTLFL